MTSALVVSLDFELHWGVRDHTSVEDYRQNLLGVREALPAMLALFAERGIHATWATVGALFCRTKEELIELSPRERPTYVDARLDPYGFRDVGEDEARDPFHFAPSLIEQIAKTPHQEIGTHTFSHFYALEPRQTAAQLEADLTAARCASAPFGDDLLRSIVFPRNQDNPDYRAVLASSGVRVLRTSSAHWAYTPHRGAEPRRRRAFRLVDAYLPLHTANSARPRTVEHGLTEVPATAFLRPFSPRTRALEGLRYRRLARAMSEAHEEDAVFHLWWHPHNFGAHTRENMDFLSALLDHFETLRREGMESMTMSEAAALA